MVVPLLYVHNLFMKFFKVDQISITRQQCWGDKEVDLIHSLGWSELAATNAPVEDEPVQPVLRMNILPARRDFFFHLLFAPKFSPSPLLPTTYQPHPPHSIARAPETSSGCAAGAGAVAVERELERLELDRLELEQDPRA